MPARGPEYRPSDVLPGTKYRIVKQLGVGGMGVVYQVVKPPEIHCVLKLMGAELTGHVEFRSRFLDEVRVLAQLDHPNIVRVFDYDTTADGTPFYVMELLQGQTVRDVLSTIRRIPPRVAFEITRQLLEALHAAHTHDVMVVHRDIKPENIFLHSPKHGDPVVKLIDFGVVALANRQHDGTFVGTWSYAAPEQIRGERATPATDLYAVGLVLYEMLAGVGPFEQYQTGTSLSLAHLNEIPEPVSKFAPWVPASVVELISAALSKDPEKRPRDAYAFAERLFELQWATDGSDPNDATMEGPLARVLSHVSQVAMPPSGSFKMGGARPSKLHRGGTIRGLGEGSDSPPAGEDALLEGLALREETVARPALPSKPNDLRRSSRERAAIVTDTFATQESDSRPSARAPMGRVGAWLALGAVALVGAASFFVLRKGPDGQAAGAAKVETALEATGRAPAEAAPKETSEPAARPNGPSTGPSNHASAPPGGGLEAGAAAVPPSPDPSSGPAVKAGAPRAASPAATTKKAAAKAKAAPKAPAAAPSAKKAVSGDTGFAREL